MTLQARKFAFGGGRFGPCIIKYTMNHEVIWRSVRGAILSARYEIRAQKNPYELVLVSDGSWRLVEEGKPVKSYTKDALLVALAMRGIDASVIEQEGENDNS